MKAVNVHDAKTHFSQLLERAHNGEEILIAKNGTPYARLVPLQAPEKREMDFLRGVFTVGAAFFEPMSEDELKQWEG